MKWSKVKKTAESLLADSLQGRVRYHVTSYGPGQSFTMARGWVTLDKHQILNAGTPQWLRHYTTVANQIREINQTTDYHDPAQQAGYYGAYRQAEAISIRAGIFSRDQFVDALQGYLDLSIDDALASDYPLTRALAMFDRRLGKRRLRDMALPETEHLLVKQFYQTRCQAEHLGTPSGS